MALTRDKDIAGTLQKFFLKEYERGTFRVEIEVSSEDEIRELRKRDALIAVRMRSKQSPRGNLAPVDEIEGL